jgi:proteasome assembly chaperone (PAC2) family protein
MDKLVELWERPETDEINMFVGWRQWADAGSISSLLPEYLINATDAKKIGEIKPDGFYLFQIPGTHHFLRPEIKLEEGYRKALRVSKNEIFYTVVDGKGLVIFLGDEPHLNVERYADAFFEMVKMLNVNRAVGVGGVYGPMPYNKDRQISCAYSLQTLKQELEGYAVRFSSYEGGATIGSYLLDRAEKTGIEFLVFYAMVPAYDLSQLSSLLQGMRIENDYKAWYDILRRLNHMFKMTLDLEELEAQSYELIASMSAKIKALEEEMPQLKIKEYIEKLTADFQENSFMPLDDVWERELGDLFDDMEES